MSYDLYFHFQDKKFPPESFSQYFSTRHHYTLDTGQAFYNNEDTGVYFSFEWHLEGPQHEMDMEYDAAFNLNYARPSPFSLEAEPEIAEFVRHFNFSVEDPQLDGMNSTLYSKEGFLRGWNHGNKFACGILNPQGPSESSMTLPSKRLEYCWNWSFERKQLNKQLGEGVFVPKIMFFKHNGEAKTFVSWPDAIPIALPEVDILLLHRDAVAKPRLIFFKTASSKAFATYESIIPLIESFPIISGAPGPYRLLSYKKAPKNLIDYFNAQPTIEGGFELLNFDHLIDREILSRN